MSRRTSRRQEVTFPDLPIMQTDLLSSGCGDDSLVSISHDFDDQSQMIARSNRFLVSPNQKVYHMHSGAHSGRQRGRKSQQLQNSMGLEHQSFVAMKPGNVAASTNLLMNDVFGQQLVMPSTHDLVIGQNMEIGSDVQGSDTPHGDVILVTNMLKSEVIEGGEVVVGAGMHAQNVGNEIVIDEHAGRHMGLGIATTVSGDEGEFDESALVIDTGSIREDIVPSIGYDCGECGAVMKSRGSLKKHILKYHTPNPEPEEEMDRIYQCTTCPYQTARRDKLDKHIGKHLAEGYTTTGKKRNKGTLPQRMRHAAEEYKCHLCPYKCTVEKALRKHNKLHQSGTKQFVVKVSCYICGKDRSTEADLRKHMKKHRDGKDFQCDVCGFASVQLKKIIQHRRMHTGEKPHLCPHCTYRSSRRDNLRSHVRRMHKKENMYIDTFNPRSDFVGE